MDSKLNNLFYGSLFHDIGKIIQRSTNERERHSKIGINYLKKFDLPKEITNQIAYHHYHELSKAKIPNNSLAYITYIADNIASGVDRRKHDEKVDRKWDKRTNLEDIFNYFGSNNSRRFFKPSEMDLNIEDTFPSERKKEFTSGEYSGIVHRIEETLQRISFSPDYHQSALNLMEATASFIPSSTNLEEVVDISLYDHLKMTTAFAMTTYQYLEDKNRYNYKSELFDRSRVFYQEDAYLLASFDLSGIQSFIYTITSSGAHKQLRSRSFYLDMMCEWISDYLLQKLSLTRANLLYSGGGHAYLLLPNTQNTINILESVEEEFNNFYINKFNTELYVAFGWCHFKADEVMAGNNLDDYRKIFQNTSRMISDKKLNRYNANVINHLNIGGKRAGKECSICHNVSNLLPDNNKCHLCNQLEEFSIEIQQSNFYEINEHASGLPIGPGKYLHSINEEDILNENTIGIVYAKNQFVSGLNQGTHLWIADYTYVKNNEFSQYTERKWTVNDNQPTPSGIKRLAVLRCDVDDLGYGFIAGFSKQGDGRYNTFTRTAAFSRSMTMFFKVYINQFAKDKKVTVIYSGGDDVFLLGAWDDVIDFAVELRDLFISWTNGKLTLSAGIGLFHEKTPVNIMARDAGELEKAAKNNGKDSITLFAKENTFKFETFIQDIYYEKLDIIREYFDKEEERGKAFIYKLLELIRNRESENRLSFARLAYLLARLEDNSRYKDHFNKFKVKMKDWFDEDDEIKKVEVALMLYVLEIREG